MAFKICLDAGHFGKYNQSPANKKYFESEAMWHLHLLLKKYLEEYGFAVIQTRSKKNSDMALQARGKKSKGCDLFISLHSNALTNSVNEKTDYPCVIVSINGKGTKLGNKLAACVTEVMGTKQKGKVISRKGSGDWDYYGVIYGATSVGTVGMIIEHSFHTQTRATNWLLDENNLNKLAKAEAEVLAEHFGLEKPVSVAKGDTVSITPDGVYYNGKGIPAWVKEKKWIVSSVKGDRAVINKSVDGKSAINSPVNVKYLVSEKSFTPYLVKITAKGSLNIRSGPGTQNAVVGVIDGNQLNGVYTIVEESNGWGLLKAYSQNRNGWISLNYTKTQ